MDDVWIKLRSLNIAEVNTTLNEDIRRFAKESEKTTAARDKTNLEIEEMADVLSSIPRYE